MSKRWSTGRASHWCSVVIGVGTLTLAGCGETAGSNADGDTSNLNDGTPSATAPQGSHPDSAATPTATPGVGPETEPSATTSPTPDNTAPTASPAEPPETTDPDDDADDDMAPPDDDASDDDSGDDDASENNDTSDDDSENADDEASDDDASEVDTDDDTDDDSDDDTDDDEIADDDAASVDPNPTSGCGAGSWPSETNYTIAVNGIPREYIVTLPSNYDPSQPYRLVFAWHGRTGTAQQIANGFGGGYYGLLSRGRDSTIFVTGQGLGTEEDPADTGWPNTGGRDVAFVEALLDWLFTSYCIDQERIFSTGFSYGGIMSNTLGCNLGHVFRAIAPMSGIGPGGFFGGGGAAQCTGDVAVWISHGNVDEVVTFSNGVNSRNYWAEANGCTEATEPTEPSPCVAYQGCNTGTPLHWCEYDGGHTIPQFAAGAIWNFFEQF